MDAGVLEVNVGVEDKTGDVEEACGVLLVPSLGLLWRMISTPVTMPVPKEAICSFACLAPPACKPHIDKVTVVANETVVMEEKCTQLLASRLEFKVAFQSLRAKSQQGQTPDALLEL